MSAFHSLFRSLPHYIIIFYVKIHTVSIFYPAPFPIRPSISYLSLSFSLSFSNLSTSFSRSLSISLVAHNIIYYYINNFPCDSFFHFSTTLIFSGVIYNILYGFKNVYSHYYLCEKNIIRLRAVVCVVRFKRRWVGGCPTRA